MTNPNDPHRGQPIYPYGAPLAQAKGAVVLLHGRGASAEDILGLAHQIALPGIAWLAPQAAAHTWYPNSFLVPAARNEPFLSSALALVGTAVQSAIEAGIPTRRIALCGFSQGACLSTEFVFRNPARYGGLIALTGGLIGTDQEVATAAAQLHGSLDGMPAFFGSGDPDPHVPWQRVEQSAAILRQRHASVTTQRYPGRPHTVTREELDYASEILKGMLSAT